MLAYLSRQKQANLALSSFRARGASCPTKLRAVKSVPVKFVFRNSFRHLWTKAELGQIQAHLRDRHRQSYLPLEKPEIPVSRMTVERLESQENPTEDKKDDFIIAKVPFVKSDVYYRWAYVLRDLWDAFDNPIATRFSFWALDWFAPHLNVRPMLAALDSEVEVMFSAVAEAIETKNMNLLRSVCDGHLSSLIEDNFAEFERLHDYRLAVHEIESRRVAVKVTFKFPPFAKETPSELGLWSGAGVHFSQPLNSKPVEDTLIWMTQAVGTCYAFLRRQATLADTPPAGLTGGEEAFPIPDRLNKEIHVKKRVMNYIKKPLTGDLPAFVKFISAMRRFGFQYVLLNGTIELNVVYGINAKHDISILPHYQEPVDEKLEAAKSNMEKEVDSKIQLIKYPELQNHFAPHALVLSSTFPMHPDGERVVRTRPWLISEFDGIRRAEKREVEKLLKLSTLSPEEIDKQFPSLRICSKDLFTKHGPKKEWFLEMERLRRVAENRLKTGELDDPQEKDSLEKLFQASKDQGLSIVDSLLAQSRPIPPDSQNKNPLHPPPSNQPPPPRSAPKGQPIGNIFDMARDHESKL